MRTWLKNFGKALYSRRGVVLDVAAIAATIIVVVVFVFQVRDTAFWKTIATTPEPDNCSVCGDGIRHQAPVLVNLNTGMIWELEIYDRNPRQPWEVAEEQRWDDWAFRFLDGNATMSWSSEDHTNIANIGEDLGKFDPAHFCHDCRGLLAKTAKEGYALLDLYDLEKIQAFPVENGAEYTIRVYTVSVYKDKDNGGLTAEVTGHLFGTQ